MERFLDETREAEQASTSSLQVGNFAVAKKSLGAYPMNDGDTQEFDVLIRSFNSQFWIERVKLTRVNNHWAKALFLEHEGKPVKVLVDKDFPRKDGHLDVNWPRLVKGRDKWDH
jgi:hypothetical protein